MRSKPLSLKRLYQMAEEYLDEKWMGLKEPERTIKTKEELAELNSFLRYVWEHRND